MKKQLYTYSENGKEFEGWANSFEHFGNTYSVCVWVREVVHPTRRWFRTKLIDYHHFMLCDFPSVEEGIIDSMAHIIHHYLNGEAETAKLNQYFGK